MSRIRQKWRPSMALVVAIVCGTLISIPLAAMLTMRLTSNQFVRETEQSLLKQSAIYAEIYRTQFDVLGGAEMGLAPRQDLLSFWSAPF